MFLSNYDQSSCVTSDGVGESTRQVIMIGFSVLILDYVFAVIGIAGDNVDAPPSDCVDLNLADLGQLNTNFRSDGIELLS